MTHINEQKSLVSNNVRKVVSFKLLYVFNFLSLKPGNHGVTNIFGIDQQNRSCRLIPYRQSIILFPPDTCSGQSGKNKISDSHVNIIRHKELSYVLLSSL